MGRRKKAPEKKRAIGLAEKPEKFTCLDAAFKNNDRLKTNTALQMEGAKIEFGVI
jgi:hypothetical protein